MNNIRVLPLHLLSKLVCVNFIGHILKVLGMNSNRPPIYESVSSVFHLMRHIILINSFWLSSSI